MILKLSTPRKQIVLSGNVSDLGDVFLLTRPMTKTEFAGQWCF